ncbi:Sodium-Independent Sulfate Anion Transporter [Manis pentadactyla]|nr:Sodium-Independent Sulfate Anion Transporter [Manis pentadactyla]
MPVHPPCVPCCSPASLNLSKPMLIWKPAYMTNAAQGNITLKTTDLVGCVWTPEHLSRVLNPSNTSFKLESRISPKLARQTTP